LSEKRIKSPGKERGGGKGNCPSRSSNEGKVLYPVPGREGKEKKEGKGRGKLAGSVLDKEAA